MKSDLSPEDFLTRSNKVKKLQFPQSDPNRVIVVCNQEGVGFKFNCYKAEFLQSYVDKLTFDATVKVRNILMHSVCPQDMRKRMEDQKGLRARCAGWISLFSIFLLVNQSHFIYHVDFSGLLHLKSVYALFCYCVELCCRM